MRTRWRALFSVLAILLGITAVCPVSPLGAATPLAPCELFTKQDAEAILKESITEERVIEATLPAGLTCRYAYRKEGSVFEVKVRLATDESIAEEGIHDSAKDVFDRQVKARRAHEYASKTLREFEGLGEGSFWSGTSLWALRGDCLVIVTVHSHLKGSFKDMDEMRAAREDQDLGYSKEVMATVMERLE